MKALSVNVSTAEKEKCEVAMGFVTLGIIFMVVIFKSRTLSYNMAHL